MTGRDAFFVHLTMALTTLSGIVFAVMKYAMESDDPFAVANHPLQPYALDAHVIVAPVALFGFGLIFHSHIWKKYRSPARARRSSGLAIMSLLIPMTLSGYLLQVSANETMRETMAILHWISSGVFALGYLVHQFSKRI